MSDLVTIGKRFSIVIPKKIRKRIRLKEGQRALVRCEGEAIIIELLPENPYEALSEALGDFSYSEKEHERKAEEWLKRVARPRY